MLNPLTWVKRNSLLFIAFLWIIFWIFPWGNWLSFEVNVYIDFLIGLIRLIIALVLFIFPGALIYLSLFSNSQGDSYFLGIIPTGFSISVMLIGLLGLVGRIDGFSFYTVKLLFFLMGLLGLIFLRNKNIKTSDILLCFRDNLMNKFLLLALGLSFVLTFNDLLFFIDDTTYLAYLTNWQYSEQLGFQNLIHEPHILELERFWLAMYPIGQALVSDLSKKPGILLFSNYLELLLVPLAVFTAYWFARFLGFSRNASAISVLVQVLIYSWMIGAEHRPVGTWFYNSMAEDKVSAVFLLAPVFFMFVIRFIKSASWQDLLLVILSGLAIALTHPVSLFFSCTISIFLAIFTFLLKKTTIKELIKVFFVIAFLISPYLVIRLIDYSSQTAFVSKVATSGGGTYELERYINFARNSTFFYGINPNVLLFVDFKFSFVYQILRYLPIMILVVAFVLAWVYIKKGEIYLYIFSSSLLVLLVTLPYTGWFFGYLTDARLIYRASWFSPFGLSAILILQEIFNRIKTTQTLNTLFNVSKLNTFFVLICFVFMLPMIFLNLSRIPYFFAVLNENAQLAMIGESIDDISNQNVISIALEESDLLLLPGVSAHTRLISFREEKLDNGHNYYLTESEIKERIYASTIIRSLKNDQTTSQERCSFINKYNVEFVVAENKDADLYLELISKCGIVVEKIYQTKDKVLLHIQP